MNLQDLLTSSLGFGCNNILADARAAGAAG